IMAVATIILVIGIRESATTNAILVITKVGIILFVIGVGCWYINSAHWTHIPPEYRKATDVPELLERFPEVAAAVPPGDYRFVNGERFRLRFPQVAPTMAQAIEDQIGKLPNTDWLDSRPDLARFLPAHDFAQVSGKQLLEQDPTIREGILQRVEKEIDKLPSLEDKWGLIGIFGLNRQI